MKRLITRSLAFATIVVVAWSIIGRTQGQVTHAAPVTKPTSGPAVAEWFQWRGPNRNGVSTETGWRTDWDKTPPKQLWKATIGQGYSSMAVRGGKVYAMGISGGTETVWCLNVETGGVLWKHSYPCVTDARYPGPRATPAVDEKFVYVLSEQAQLLCLDTETGKPHWGKELRSDRRLGPPKWLFAGSPLVLGQLVIVNLGTAGMGLDKTNGRIVWENGSGTCGYASPVPVVQNKQTSVAIMGEKNLIVVNPADGKVLWQFPWPTNLGVNAADPIVIDDSIFLTSGYGRGSALLTLGANKATWEGKEMQAQSTSPVYHDGFVYGGGGNTGAAPLVCLEMKSGRAKWKEHSVAVGGLILVDGKLLVQASGGDLLLVKPNPDGYNLIARTSPLKGRCWTAPVLSGGKIFCRSHDGDLVCLDVKAQ